MSEWQPIETAPRDGTWVLGWLGETEFYRAHPNIIAWTKHNHVPIYGWVYSSGSAGDGEVEACEPTHWQPLPPPPAT